MRLNVHTLFNVHNKPQLTIVNTGKQNTTFILYHPHSQLTIAEIEDNKSKIKQLIERSLAAGATVMLSNYKAHLYAFGIETTATSEVYDVVLPTIMHLPKQTLEESLVVASKVIDYVSKAKPQLWQKLFANAGVAYNDMQKRGISIQGKILKPIWSQDTFSGRSKTLGFGLHSANDKYDIKPIDYKASDIFIHFDWKAADIRAAALLSGDEHLLELSYQADPYITISEKLGITERSAAKTNLLQAINSLNIDAAAVKIFPKLLSWIRESRRQLHSTGKLSSLLGRQFNIKLVSDKKEDPRRTILNATMQGSVAHAMHNTIKRVWDLIGSRLLCENHDSIVAVCDIDCSKSFINQIVEIMKKPYDGVLDSNPTFPVVVSVGYKWRKWRKYSIYS